MTNIVVAVDGSENAMSALGWARELGRSRPAPEFYLVHAYHVAVPVSESLAYQYEALRKDSVVQGQAVLGQAEAAVASVGKACPCLLQDDPSRAVLGVAKSVKPELIAVGRRGLGRAASLFLGSVSMAILHGANSPVLLVHDAPPRTVRRVLVAVDGSEHGARSLAWAAEWAPEAELTAIHALASPSSSPTALRELNLTLRDVVDLETRAVVSRTVDLSGVDRGRVEALGAAGDPAEQVLREYNSGPYDLLVIGSRGDGTVGKRLLGSVSERLVRLVHGPVVVVK